MFEDNDTKLLEENMNDILKKIALTKNTYLEPTKIEKDKIVKLVLNFLIDKKRKVYGGTALNALIKDVEPNDAIYDDDINDPDIDFYSPDPLKDLTELCDLLHSAGFKDVVGQEATHEETYSIFVNQLNYVDITYVPTNIYNRMPFRMINDIHYIHPHFMTIDYLRMLTDPIISFWRIEKSFKRLILLWKHYPIPNNIEKSLPRFNISKISRTLDYIYKYLGKKKSCITVGFYAYNRFLYECVNSKNNINKNIRPVDIPYYEFISTKYKEDTEELITKLQNEFTDITYEECYPFFQFTGYFTKIYKDDNLVAIIYDHNNKCTPFITASSIMKNKEDKNNGDIIIGTSTLTLMYALINIMMARTNNDNKNKNLFYIFASHIIYMSEFYKKNNNKTIFDNTIFQEFKTECMGTTSDPMRDARNERTKRRKEGKPMMFRYDPSKDNYDPSKWKFKNSSGNIVNNDKNKKLFKDLINKDTNND